MISQILVILQFDFNDFSCSFSIYSLSGARHGLFPFPLNSEFINNYRRLYGPVQLTSIMNGSDLSKSPSRRSPVDSKRLKGKSKWTFLDFNVTSCDRCLRYHVIYDADMVGVLWRALAKDKNISENIINLRSKNTIKRSRGARKSNR